MQFSSARAIEHVRAVAGTPRPMGSPQNDAVRSYLLEQLSGLGLQVEVQEATTARFSNDGFVAARPKNVIARIDGTGEGDLPVAAKLSRRASPTDILTSDNRRLSEPRNGVGGVADQDFYAGESELVLAATDLAAIAELNELEDQARDLARNSRAELAWRAYASDLRHFQTWCSEHDLEPLPADPSTVAMYLAALEPTHSPSTIRRRLAAISVSHQFNGVETPTADAGVKSVWAGIRRRNGVAPRKVRAVRTKMITTLVAPLGNRLIDVRDRALILIGFAGALRRSELVALDIDDVAENADGLVLAVRRSKTDQDAEGEIRGIPYGSHPATCPVRAWRAWIDASDTTTGPAFRGVDRHGRLRSTRLSDRAVADMIKRRAAGAGLDGSFAGHSLRSGFATEGYAQGTPELAIMRHGRWKSASVMRGYVQEGTIWSDNAAARLGL